MPAKSKHNVAHLGIVTGLCLSEAAVKYTPRWVGHPIVLSAVLASISTSLAKILGGAIALQMLFGPPTAVHRVLAGEPHLIESCHGQIRQQTVEHSLPL